MQETGFLGRIRSQVTDIIMQRRASNREKDLLLKILFLKTIAILASRSILILIMFQYLCKSSGIGMRKIGLYLSSVMFSSQTVFKQMYLILERYKLASLFVILSND